MDTNQSFEKIPQELFEFVQRGADLHDKKLKTKSRGYFADAFIRFKKNKSSLVAACIIGFLILFAIVAPLISPYSITDKDNVYNSFAPYVESIAKLNIGILDGGVTRSSQNELQIEQLHAIGKETGMDPIIKVKGTVEKTQMWRGKEVVEVSYVLKNNRYYEIGVKKMIISVSEYMALQEYQNETGIQVLYPIVEKKDAFPGLTAAELDSVSDNANVWYVCSDTRGTPAKDENGNLIAAYSTNIEKTRSADTGEFIPYDSQRIEGDNGDYIYCIAKSGSVECRICYYNYYIYRVGHAPSFVFGTDEYGRDLFMAIGTGARFSLIFSVLVSVINLTIGAIYGAIQGYYGGVIDLVLDRISDILSGVPFIVVTTLFQLHLAKKVGVVPSFLFAFVLTGWIGMAALTRKQFYRFKGQEYIYAAKTLGASDWRLMFKHIFPNSLGTIITSCVLVIPGVISSETSLTYLGIINLSEFAGTSIGELMASGQLQMTTAPHAMLFPSLFVSLLLISFNLFGNGLRDAFNPSMRGMED